MHAHLVRVWILHTCRIADYMHRYIEEHARIVAQIKQFISYMLSNIVCTVCACFGWQTFDMEFAFIVCCALDARCGWAGGGAMNDCHWTAFQSVRLVGTSSWVVLTSCDVLTKLTDWFQLQTMHVYAHINLCTKCEMRNIHNYIVVRMCEGIPLLCVIARKQIRNPHKYFHIPSICSAQVCANAQKKPSIIFKCAHTQTGAPRKWSVAIFVGATLWQTIRCQGVGW